MASGAVGNSDATWTRRLQHDIRHAIERSFSGWKRIGWDRPVRPRHVPVPSIPRDPLVVAGRAFGVWAIAVVFASIPAFGILHRDLTSAGYQTDKPFIGSFYSALDLPTFLGPMMERAGQYNIAPAWIHFGIAFGIAAVLTLPFAFLPILQRAKMPKKYVGTLPDTEWATIDEMDDAGLLDDGTPGFVIGSVTPPPIVCIPQKPLLLVYKDDSHVLVKASSRSGKDVGHVDMTFAKWLGSIIALDRKGESYSKHAGMQENYYGKTVYRLNVAAPPIGSTYVDFEGNRVEEQFGTSYYNFLDEIDWGTDREYAQSLQVSRKLVAKQDKDFDGENGHWFRTSSVLGRALMYKVAYDPLETMRSVSRVAMILAGDEIARKTGADDLRKDLATDGAEAGGLHELLEQYLGFSASRFGSSPAWVGRAQRHARERAMKEISEKIKEIGISCSEADAYRFEVERRRVLERETARIERALEHPDMERDINRTLQIQGDEASSVQSTITGQLSPWLDPNVIENTRYSSFRIPTIANGDAPVFCAIVNPLELADVYAPIYRIWFDLALRKLIPAMKEDLQTKQTISPFKYPVLWSFNEIYSLGDVPQLPETIGVAASYKHKFIFYYQNHNQLMEQFGDKEVISGNCELKINHTPEDPDDVEPLSKALGERMILTESVQYNGLTRSKTVQPSNVALMTPPQVTAIPKKPRFHKIPNADGSAHVDKKRRGYLLAFLSGLRPIYATKVQSFADDFPEVYNTLRAYPTSLPNRTIIGRDDIAMADAQAKADQLREKMKPRRESAKPATSYVVRYTEAVPAPAPIETAGERPEEEAAPAQCAAAPVGRPRQPSASERVTRRADDRTEGDLELPDSFAQFEQ